MKKINFDDKAFVNAQKVFDFFKIETNCLDASGQLTVRPRYVVALGDDPVTVFYAAIIMKKALSQFGSYPELVCCGGNSMLSKLLNQTTDGFIAQGEKLAQIAQQLDADFPVKALTKANSVEDIARELISHVHGDPSPVIFCPTQRMSKLWERVINASLKSSLDTYWYVHGENFKDIFTLYNGGAMASGISILSEAAYIYDALNIAGHTHHTVCYDGGIPKFIIHAGISLRDDYPLFVTQSIWSAPKQYWRLFIDFKINHNAIDFALQEKIRMWKCAL